MNFSRREILHFFSSAIPALLLGCQKTDLFGRERVCVHVFDPKSPVPEPLLEKSERVPERSKHRSYFQIGLPELLLCTTVTKFLELFQYFWPVSRKEFEKMQGSISVRFEKIKITNAEDIEDLSEYVASDISSLRSQSSTLAVVLTYNDHTKYWTHSIVEECKRFSVDEIVIFKDKKFLFGLASIPLQFSSFSTH